MSGNTALPTHKVRIMSASPAQATEYLFSYGTLQLEAVQLATFGRLLAGQADRLPGYRLTLLEIRDAAVLATSGKTHHPIASFTGLAADGVPGTVFAITAAELAHADAYEVSDYRRERVRLDSGQDAWVYVDARDGASD
ncbi:UDP-N-acetylmuramate--alanine ligase [Pandoraea thiooxydans]|nr:UDP-N-acetylmuramate--alanine ligase [Pandoraea thiooxydans]